MSLPKPDESAPVVDWDSEIVSELRGDNMFEEMVEMAAGEFTEHINDLKKMKANNMEGASNWPAWKVAHSIKGLCLSLGFSRLAGYAKSVEKLKEEIKADDLDEIVNTMQELYDAASKECEEKAAESK